MTVQAQALTILREPFVEPLPFTDQRLVGHLGAVLVQCDQPCLSQRVQHRPQLGGFFRLVRQLIQCRPPAGIFGAFAQFCQAQKDVTGEILAGPD